MIHLRSLLLVALCCVSALGVGYENVTRINAANYDVFGADLPDTFSSTTGYAHNRGVWPGSVWDFSGCPLAINSGGSTIPNATGALITPRHLLCAHHYAPTSGTVYLVTASGTTITRTISAVSSLIGSDIRILTLDSAATGCKVYPIPTSASVSTLVGATAWCLDRPRTVVTRRITDDDDGGDILHTTDASGGTIIPGDSGQPVFLTRGTELVLLGTHYNPTRFPSVANYLSAIQSFCSATSQTVTTVSVDPATWAMPLGPTGELQR